MSLAGVASPRAREPNSAAFRTPRRSVGARGRDDSLTVHEWGYRREAALPPEFLVWPLAYPRCARRKKFPSGEYWPHHWRGTEPERRPKRRWMVGSLDEICYQE
jgi:hypothetical protein